MRLPALAIILFTLSAPAFAQGATGPQATITCPTGAVDIWPGSSIQNMVNANPAGTTFCLRAGTFPITASITPKTGDTFSGEYGAILDGSGWVTSDDVAAVFRAHNENIDNVTIRNLVIRNFPKRGIHAYSGGFCDSTKRTCTYALAPSADAWVIDHNEIVGGTYGVDLPTDGVLTNNIVHGASIGGWSAYLTQRPRFENNEFYANGNESKIMLTRDAVFRGNYVHNQSNCVWYDGENKGSLIENNLCEDMTGVGVYYEVSGTGIIRNNTVRRVGGHCVFISTSHDVEVYGNVCEDDFRGIQYFANCTAINDPNGVFWTTMQPDGTVEHFALANVSAHDNTIRVGTQPGALASAFSTTGCTQAEVDSYSSQNLTFSRNAYTVPSVSGSLWYWNAAKSWLQWQSLPQDATSTLNGTSSTVPPPPPPAEICGDGIDNDGDGLVDEGCSPTTVDALAPTVTLTQPKRSGNSGNYSVTVTATDNVGVAWFQLSLDGAVIATQPGTYSKKLLAGSHQFKAEAKDAAGNYTSVTQNVTR